MKLRNSVIGLTVLAFFLDWHSTIIQGSYIVEENPFMRSVWQNYGLVSFTLLSIVFCSTFVWIETMLYKIRKWYVLLPVPFLIFKLLVALTNYSLISCQWTCWFQF